jgi:tetraacyldisaccharide 4'-kinase
MTDVGRGPWAVGRREPNPAVVAFSRGLELVNAAARALYARGVLHVERAAVPVISVGNIAIGGTGKTPLVAAVAAALARRGAHPAILTVAGATHLVLDDGFQHWRLARDLDILTLDSRDPLCERRPRREHPRVLRRAHVAVVPTNAAADRDAVREKLAAIAPGLRLVFAELVPTAVELGADRLDVAWLRGRRVLAFAGIGSPERFAETLRSLASEVVELVRLPDHHVYDPTEVAALRSRADALGAVPVTTAKDAVKLRAEELAGIAVLAVALEDPASGFDELISPVMDERPIAPGKR